MAINRFGLHCFISSARSHRQFIIDDIHIKSLVKYTHTIKPYDFLIFAVPVTLINVQSMIIDFEVNMADIVQGNRIVSKKPLPELPEIWHGKPFVEIVFNLTHGSLVQKSRPRMDEKRANRRIFAIERYDAQMYEGGECFDL